ncbi:kinase-like domain-containing protein [Cubamyces menziesii]|nr:kinase-like domain-containing protein [Cubamyces menziesii]
MDQSMPGEQDAMIDGIFNYDIHNEIGRGNTAVIFRATCKRGRLRGRVVAVKKTSRISTTKAARNCSAASTLHASLCHPSVLSLMSYFSAPSGYYQVLELCQGGSLAGLLDTREDHILTEEELRGLSRTFTDALIYLRKELVLHRDINPENILITGDGRMKLSGFGSAQRLSTADATTTEFCGSANYVSPEILCGRPYSFPSDLWSFGCVLLTCLSGLPPFDGADPDMVYNNICSARFVLPDTVSAEAENLVQLLLRKNPHDRIALHRLPWHPFLDSSLPTNPLEFRSPPKTPTMRHTGLDSLHPDNMRPTSQSRYPALLSKDPTRLHPKASFGNNTKKPISKRLPLVDITNVYPSAEMPRDSYQDGSQGGPSHSAHRSDARACSAPVSTAKGSFSAGSSTSTTPRVIFGALSSATGRTFRPTSTRAHSSGTDGCKQTSQGTSPRTQLRRVLSDSYGLLPGSRRTTPLTTGRPVLYSRPGETPKQRASSQATSATAVAVSLGQSAPAPELFPSKRPLSDKYGGSTILSIDRLKPQTYKISRGQLVVLPSRSLLVDFREGERRKGGTGKEVLVINPEGRTIQVFDAPHLSTPCCLAEATTTYTVEDLPQRYTAQYNDAARIVDHLKSRMPKLVHYSGDAKCTLMANGPPGDIEIVMPADDDRKTNRAIRLRLCVKKRTLEISRYFGKSSKDKARSLGEWTKKIVALGPSLTLMEEDRLGLDDMERLAVRELSNFVSLCDAANLLQVGDVLDLTTESDGKDIGTVH